MKRIISLILAVLMLCLCACGKAADETTAAPAVTEGQSKPQAENTQNTAYDGNAIVLESENYKINVAMLQYFFAKVYQEYLTPYGELAAQIVDPAKPLREQKCPLDQTGKGTWFDFFAQNALTMVNEYVLLAEEAKANGFSLTEKDLSDIEAELESLKTMAAEAGYSDFQAYLQDYYGTFTTLDTLRECFILSLIAQTYRAEKHDTLTYTDEDYLAYAEKNPQKCYKAQFLYMRLAPVQEEGKSAEELKAEWEDIKKTAVEFNNAVTDIESFKEQAKKFMLTRLTVVPTEEETKNNPNFVTQQQLDQYVEGVFATQEYATGTGNKGIDWLFEKGRLAGERTIITDEENMQCELFYMVRPYHLSDKPTVNVRHILINSTTEGDAFKAKTKAEELYNSWKDGKANEESFAVMAMEHTQDNESRVSGGLISALTQDKYSKEFTDWCFDPLRKAGDCEVIEASYGYHIMFFVEHGMPEWKEVAHTELITADMAKYTEELAKKHAVTVTGENLAKCPDPMGR